MLGRARLVLFGGGALLGLLAILVVASPGRARSRSATPFTPRSSDQVLERLPQRLGSDALSARDFGSTPADAATAERLAREAIQRYQESSDPRYLGHAEARLAAFWDKTDVPTGIGVLRAKVRASNHEFEPALLDLNQVLSKEPEQVQALFERATILSVLGRYDAAQADCLRLKPVASGIFSSGCSALVAGATGHAVAAAEELSGALAAAGRVSAGEASWAESLLGELALRSGRVAQAEEHLRRALAGAPQDAYTLGVLSDLLLDQRRPQEVVKLLASFERIDALLLRLAIAEAQLGLAVAGPHVEELAERFAAARLRGSDVHRREEARFELVLRKNAERALQLSLANLRVQREIWDSRLVLEAALAAGKPAAAQDAMALVRSSGLEDPTIARLVRELEGVR
jgi:tetratricopeptide (TPR) repeat protein